MMENYQIGSQSDRGKGACLAPLLLRTFFIAVPNAAKERLPRERTVLKGVVQVMERNERGGGRGGDKEGAQRAERTPVQGYEKENVVKQPVEVRAGEEGIHKARRQ